MGFSFTNRLILLCVMLSATGAVTHLRSFNIQPTALNLHDLNQYLSDIPNWRQQIKIFLSPEVEDVLELDDYLNSEYVNGQKKVSLYIGQYYSTKKIGAVHHPLVCLPGQGLKVTQHSTGKMSVKKNSQSYNISYSSIITEIDNQKNLIIYWFQAGNSTFSNTFPQKLASFWNSLIGKNNKNGYVRIITPLNGKSMKEAKTLIFEFIDVFYPIYLDYLAQNEPDKV